MAIKTLNIMTESQITKNRISEMAVQAQAARAQADRTDIGTKEKFNLLGAAQTIEVSISILKNSLKKDASETFIHDLQHNTADAELKHKRQRQSVRSEDGVFLPSWEKGNFALPNSIIRSALFSSCSNPLTVTGHHKIKTQGQNAIIVDGHLVDYDRLVWAALLTIAKDTPLAESPDSPWTTVTYWQLATAMNINFGTSAKKAIRSSLLRLMSARLEVRVKHLNFNLPQLVEISLEEVPGRASRKNPDATTERIVFRIPKNVAELFGRASWTKVPESAMKFSDLVRWLAIYYSSHAQPYPLPLKDLYDFSGSTCGMAEFKNRLEQALKKLAKEETPEEIRVKSYHLDPEKKTMTVKMCRWTHQEA